MKAVILAAGLGSRLSPITDYTPKILVEIGGRPILDHIIGWLKYYGITEIALNLHHLSETIIDYLEYNTPKGIKIGYSYEENLLGTSGAIKKLKWFIDETCLIVYGDILSDFNLVDILECHQRVNSLMTLAVVRINRQDVGKVIIDKDMRVIEFYEKKPDIKSEFANAGIYIIEPEIINFVPDGYSDFGNDIIPEIIKEKQNVHAYILDGYYNDVGTMERYLQSNKDVINGKIKLKSIVKELTHDKQYVNMLVM